MDFQTQKEAQVAVIMVPFPSQSHLNQLLHLSCLIAARNLPLYYAATATHLRQAKLRFNDTTRLQNSQIHFHEFPTPHNFLSPPPTPNPTTKFPTHLQPSFDSSLHLRRPMAALMAEISPTARRLVVIHDVVMAYVVQDIGDFPNAESYAFHPISAFAALFDGILAEGNNSHGIEIPHGIPSVEGCCPPEILNFCALQSEFLKLTDGTIFNSCREIEGTYIDLLGKESGKQNWAIGLLNSTPNRGNSNTQKHKCLEWLDKQPPNSVLYVSFGTTISMEDEQIKELAIGLEQSGEKFIWVLRDADRGDIFAGDVKGAQLPEGYEERVKEVGMVVRDWAPQVEILGHPSIGGFMSHCGWNSCLESITMGVPIAAWPMHSDQPKNAFLATDILKVGLAVIRWEEREKIVNSSTIARVVERLIASEEGEEMRKRAKEIGGATRQAVEEGGASCLELDSFIGHITR